MVFFPADDKVGVKPLKDYCKVGDCDRTESMLLLAVPKCQHTI